MLSQDDERHLEVISTYLEQEDPKFAAGLREGRPRRPRGDCRWPLVLATVVGVVVFLLGLVIQAVVVMLLGVAATVCAGAGYWWRVTRSQRPPSGQPR